MKYQLIKEKNKIIAAKFIAEGNEHIAGDGICSVHTDDEGHQFVYVPNPNRILNGFDDHIKDAIDQIMNGIGDVLLSSSSMFCVFNKMDSVIFYIDRNYGNLMKMKSRLGWKDAKFGWCLKGGYQYSFNPSREVLENGDLLSPFFPDDRKNIMKFSSKEEAEKKMAELEKTASETIDVYKKYCEDEDSEKHKEYFNSQLRVVNHLWNNFYEHDEFDNPGKFSLKVCQMVLEE